MAILNILHFPDPRLRNIAQPVEAVDDNIRTLVDDMLETMYAAPGIGLAATQVNVHKRVIVIDISEEKNQPLYLINPEVIELARTDAQPPTKVALLLPQTGPFASVAAARFAMARRARSTRSMPIPGSSPVIGKTCSAWNWPPTGISITPPGLICRISGGGMWLEAAVTTMASNGPISGQP